MLPIPHEKEKNTAGACLRLQALMELFYFHTDLQTYKVPTPGEMVVGHTKTCLEGAGFHPQGERSEARESPYP